MGKEGRGMGHKGREGKEMRSRLVRIAKTEGLSVREKIAEGA